MKLHQPARKGARRANGWAQYFPVMAGRFRQLLPITQQAAHRWKAGAVCRIDGGLAYPMRAQAQPRT